MLGHILSVVRCGRAAVIPHVLARQLLRHYIPALGLAPGLGGAPVSASHTGDLVW